MVTPAQRRKIDAAVEITGSEAQEIAFNHAALCQIGLPRSRFDGLTYERDNGRRFLRIQAEKAPYGTGFVPYGVRPRLTLIHLMSEAVRTKSQEIDVGGSVHEFLKTLGMDTSGRGYADFRRQAQALFSCQLTIGFLKDTPNGPPRVRLEDMRVANEFNAWLSNDGAQAALWPGIVELTPEFFNSATSEAVPLDKRAITALKQSPIGLDIYSFLAHRLHRIPQHKPLRLSWSNLSDQFGVKADSAKRQISRALKDVLTVYPEAKVESVRGGLMLKNSLTPIRTIQASLRAVG